MTVDFKLKENTIHFKNTTLYLNDLAENITMKQN